MDSATEIAGLVTTITAMAGFIVWLFKDTLGRADKSTDSWKSQADEWRKVAQTNADSSKDLSALLVQALDALKRIEADIANERRETRK